MIFVVIFRFFFDFAKFIKHHQVTNTPKTLRNPAWNHLRVLWFNFEKNRRFFFSMVQALGLTFEIFTAKLFRGRPFSPSTEGLFWNELWNNCETLPDFDHSDRVGMKFTGPGTKSWVDTAFARIDETIPSLINRAKKFECNFFRNFEIGNVFFSKNPSNRRWSWYGKKTEDLTWDENGARVNGAWNYKVPMDKVLPKILNITLNPEVPDFENS